MQAIQEKNSDKAIVGANHESVKTNCRNIVQSVLLMQSAAYPLTPLSTSLALFLRKT